MYLTACCRGDVFISHTLISLTNCAHMHMYTQAFTHRFPLISPDRNEASVNSLHKGYNENSGVQTMYRGKNVICLRRVLHTKGAI